MEIKAVERTDATVEFFDATSVSRLVIQLCMDCNQPQFVSIGATAGVKRCRPAPRRICNG